MPTSPARILANQKNAARSTGPRTTEGKEQSRRNALKHGMTGNGIVLAEADAIEIERRSAAFVIELKAKNEIEVTLARRAAMNSVRMERGADQQTAALTERVRQVELGFVLPEWAKPEDYDQLRSEAARIAMFDPSKEASLARRYEAAAERAFFRALKDLRQIQSGTKSIHAAEVQAKADVQAVARSQAEMGSFLAHKKQMAKVDFLEAELGFSTPSRSPRAPISSKFGIGNELAFAVGRSR